MIVPNSTPLVALDAVVLDTETTGLDPASARIVEVGVVRIARGRVDAADTFHCLVRPDTPIPPAASAIHGIDDARVADASQFPEIWPKLSDFIAGEIVIGH